MTILNLTPERARSQVLILLGLNETSEIKNAGFPYYVVWHLDAAFWKYKHEQFMEELIEYLGEKQCLKIKT